MCRWLVSVAWHLPQAINQRKETEMSEIELALQNQAMREALKHYAEEDVRNRKHYPPELAKEALALPDLAADILRKRDAETLRKSATRIDEPMYPDEPKTRLDFNQGWNAKCADLLRLAAELEKS
jgi:hypothetical protein